MPRKKNISVTFHGAAGTVTGSKHLVRTPAGQILLDCGMFQGPKELRARNWSPFPFRPSAIDAVALSHAHIDHSGQLPRLVRDGFNGPVYCTPATASLTEIMLRDAAYLQEEQAERANRYKFSKHAPALPLYTMEDAEATIELLVPRDHETPVDVLADTRITFRQAGHILGSASVDVCVEDPARHVLFSGDIGRWDRPILKDPVSPPAADFLICESTYGNRLHSENPAADLARIVRGSAERGGVLLIPAFALGRTQEIVWRLRQLEDANEIPVLPVYVDSPMAIDVTRVYLEHREEHDLDAVRLRKHGLLQSNQFRMTRTVEASKALNDLRGPAIIISASGMATGGRILHHLKRWLPEQRTTVVIVGFQAYGTRGRSLLEGTETLRIHGHDTVVRAHVETINGLSAHADQGELLRWMGGVKQPPRQTYLVHGEAGAQQALVDAMKKKLGWTAQSARDGQRVTVL